MRLSLKAKKILRIVIPLLVIAVVVACVFFATRSSGSDDGLEDIVTGTVARRDVVTSISATGKVVSGDAEDIKAPELIGQQIAEVNVSEGDIVSEGQVLCSFDTTNLLDQRQNLYDRIAETRTTQNERRRDFEDAKVEAESNRTEGIEAAEVRLVEERALEAEARKALSDAQIALDNYIANGGSEDDPTGRSLVSTRDSRRAELSSREINAAALQASLDRLNAADVNDTDQLMSSYDEAANATVDSLNSSIENINTRLENSVIKAGRSGTVTMVNVKAGDIYTGGIIASVEREDILLVDAYVDEYDIPDVSVGMEAVLKTDATRNEELPGTITYVAPKPEGGSVDAFSSLSGLMGDQSSSGISSLMSGMGSSGATYLVKITIDAPNDRLRLGMNVRVSIITDRAENVLTVPYDAVRTDDDGKYYVEVIEPLPEGEKESSEEKDNIKKIPVEKGIEGTYYIEVKSKELKEGMTVTVPETDTKDSVDDLLNMMGSGAGI